MKKHLKHSFWVSELSLSFSSIPKYWADCLNSACLSFLAELVCELDNTCQVVTNVIGTQ